MTSISATANTPPRLQSLDFFRAPPVAAMILVNNPGNGDIYAPLEHAEWNGSTPTDLIFLSFFLLLVFQLVMYNKKIIIKV